MIKKYIKSFLHFFGLTVIKLENELFNKIPIEATSKEIELIKLSKKYSMNSSLRSWIVITALKKVFENGIEGDFVETGVWKGGNLILFQKYIEKYNSKDKKIFGYDTFESGMPEPTNFDKDFKNLSANEYKDNKSLENYSAYHNVISLNQVKENFVKTTANSDNLFLIKGKTNDTLRITKNLPDKISILKLGTCFYESTKFELNTLYDRLEKGGFLIVDDYGWWKGSRLAHDEFFKNKKDYFHFVDHTCRFMIK